MTTATQQIPSNPALEFAQSILDVTNNGLELIEILRDIAQDTDEVATTNDRIAATNILNDRAFGKSPKQITPSAGPNPDPTPETDANYLEPPAKPESPRLVTRIDESLNRSLGPAPSAHSPIRHSRERGNPESCGASHSPEPFDPNSIHFTIQQHILAITNNGQMLRDILLEIARACPEPVEGAEDDPEASPEHEPALSKASPEPVEGSKGRRITPYHRRRAVILLLDRALGTDPGLVRNGLCPDCRQSWTTHTDSSDHPERGPVANPVLLDDDEIEAAKPETWDKVIAELKRLEDEGERTPGPPGPEIDYSAYMPPDDFDLTPYLEQAEAFKAKVALRIERQKQWPEIEERRRKKLAQIYPSHSDDEDKAPDT